MAITILPPAPATASVNTKNNDSDEDYDFDEGGVDLEGDVKMDADMRESKGTKQFDIDALDIVTPGEIVTDEPQWMRSVTIIKISTIDLY